MNLCVASVTFRIPTQAYGQTSEGLKGVVKTLVARESLYKGSLSLPAFMPQSLNPKPQTRNPKALNP